MAKRLDALKTSRRTDCEGYIYVEWIVILIITIYLNR